jgi:methylmalonyl-CoA/ethylmalonyl-CoA epimerase
MAKMAVDHIGVVVPDLDQAIETFRTLFGIEPEGRQERPDVGVRLVMFHTANVTIELLQYLDYGSSFSKDVMGSGFGINHVCFKVDSVDKAIKHMEDNGVEMIDGFPVQGAHGKVAFFKPEKTHGFFFEVCQPD